MSRKIKKIISVEVVSHIIVKNTDKEIKKEIK